MASAPLLARCSIRPAIWNAIVPLAVRETHHVAPIAKLLDSQLALSEPVTVHGFVRSVRSQKSHSFVSLGDGSSMAPLQAVVPADRSDGLTVGAAVSMKGSWVASKGSGQSHELQVHEVQIVGPSDAKTFPVQKKYQSPEFLRTMPHLRTRTSFNSALLQLRSAAISSVDRYFSELNFVQAHTPIITSSDCEGAGEVFVVAPSDQGLGAADDAKTSDSFFRDPKYLTVSSQLHLEALAQSVGNVWTLSPTFRAERSDTSRHLSEFYMLEAEQSFIDDLSVVMDLLEGMLRHLATDLYEKGLTREILSGSKHHSPDLTPRDEVRERWNGLMAGDWPRITFSDAIDLLRSTQKRFQHPVSWKEGLHAEHEKYLATAVGKGKPVFVTHYPRAMKAFYMRRTPDADPSDEMQPDRSTVECFDLLVPEFCEIAGGSMREHRLKPLLNAMRLKGMAPSESQDSGTDAAEGSAMSTRSAASLDWYLDLRRWGSPPHGGFGLGFDRLLAYLSGVQSIRDIVTFPRWYGRCDC